jgi:hypothetical protein
MHTTVMQVFVVHGGLFAQDGVTLDDIAAIDRFCEPPDSGKLLQLAWQCTKITVLPIVQLLLGVSAGTLVHKLPRVHHPAHPVRPRVDERHHVERSTTLSGEGT